MERVDGPAASDSSALRIPSAPGFTSIGER
jgi:hypothetical protein